MSPDAVVNKAPPVVELDDVVVRYGTRRRGAAPVVAADHVTLSIADREVVGLVGESGSGKSTVARVAALLEKPTEGTVRIDGVDGVRASGAAQRALRKRLQVVFQDPYDSLNPRHRIGAAIAEPLVIQGIGDAESRARRVAELLEQVGLNPALIDRFPHQLSGGQLQRVSIARALSVEPDLLVLDEPVSALDVSVQAQVLALLDRLHQELGLAYLLIAHDLAVVYRLCERIVVMYFGTIVEELASDDLVAHSLHPYTWSLLDASPSLVVSASDDQNTVQQPAVAGAGPSSQGCPFADRCAFAQERCRTERPQLRAVGQSGQRVACHFAGTLSRPVSALEEAGAGDGS